MTKKKPVKKPAMKFLPGAVIDEPGNSMLHKTGSWRTERPIINKEKCTACGICWVVCPDGAPFKKGEKFDINYDYCKGCLICKRECPFKAIDSVDEER
jgi:pyruvate ferredoxin oxidoreductase delta subunit